MLTWQVFARRQWYPRFVNRWNLLRLVAGAVVCLTAAYGFQKKFRQYPATEYATFELPPDADVPAEFVFGRLMYPEGGIGYRGGFGRFSGGRDWREGNTQWTNDYPRSDRHLMVAVNRLTRINGRSVEQPINLDDGDDVYNWPFLYAARAGFMDLSDAQIAKLRDYIDRGGFFIGDDMWGDQEYAGMMATMQRLYPGRPIEELQNDNAVFHTVFDLTERYQILGEWSRGTGRPLNGGNIPHWQGVYDDKKRLVVAIWVNNDTGDSWEWADEPTYPERYSALGIRITLNHMVYALTH
jgi:hypothetical protein